MNRRQFNKTLAAAGVVSAVTPFGIVRAQATKLKVGVILPRSGVQGLIGQSCQKGADLAPGVIKEMLGVDIELMNADWESNVDTARTRAERLIQEGAHVLVGPFDSGAATAIAQVAEQRGVPFVINIAAGAADHRAGLQVRVPQLPDRGRHRAQRPRADGGPVPRRQRGAADGRVHARQRHVRPGDDEGDRAILPTQTQLPFKIVETILVRSCGEGPDRRGRQGEGRRTPTSCCSSAG
jgi:branched-chain amino acid transport system substrate-binding protein